MKKKWITTIMLLAGMALPAMANSLDLTDTSQYFKVHPQFHPYPDEGKAVQSIDRFGPVGIGIHLLQPAFQMQVRNVEPGSPAEATGKLKMDQIIDRINGQVLEDMDPRQILGDIIAKAEATDGVVKLVVREYYLRTGDESILRTIQFYADCMKKSLFNGAWGHKGVGSFTYSSSGHLNAAGLHVLTFLILAKECGVEVDGVMLQSALKYFYKFAGHGNVAYGDGLPETSFVDNGKTGALAFGMQAAAGLTPEGEKSIYAKARDISAGKSSSSNPVASLRRTARHGNRSSS